MPNIKIDQNKKIFDDAEPQYEKAYFDNSTGGYVLVHNGHNRGESYNSEKFVAEVFARNGSTVVLLDESEAVEGMRPDALVDGEIWDFKRLSPEVVGFANRVQAGIREARKQGAVKVAYHIDRIDYDLEKIKKGMRRAFQLDGFKQLQGILLVFQDGNFDSYNRSNLGI